MKNIFIAAIAAAKSSLVAIQGPGNPAPDLFVGVGDVGGSFQEILIWVLGVLLQFVGLVATIFLILGAFWYMTSAGNEDLAKKGKSMMLKAIIGFMVAFMSFVILKVVENALTGDI